VGESLGSELIGAFRGLKWQRHPSRRVDRDTGQRVAGYPLQRPLLLTQESFMSDHHTYKKLEIVGSSTTSVEDAINNALAETAKSVKNLEWFEVGEIRGHIQDAKVAHYQVTLKIGFRIEAS